MSKSPKQQKASPPHVELVTSVSMSVQDFANFLAVSQDRKRVEVEEAAAIIARYDTVAERGNPPSHMTLKGFTHYMLCQETSPPPGQRSEVVEDMGRSLSDYLIASSHNTYLTGHQLHGESSVDMYIKARGTCAAWDHTCTSIHTCRFCILDADV